MDYPSTPQSPTPEPESGDSPLESAGYYGQNPQSNDATTPDIPFAVSRHPDGAASTALTPVLPPPPTTGWPGSNQGGWEAPRWPASTYGSSYGAGYGNGWPHTPYPPLIDQAPARRRRPWGVILLVALLALLVGGGAGAAIARFATGTTAAIPSSIVVGSKSAPNVAISSGTTQLQKDTETVAAAVEPSVVKITAFLTNGESVGSGDILTTSGYIVTNDHVVQGENSLQVTLNNGKTYTATLVGQDAADDLAVVKISASGLTPIAFANSSQVTVGEFAIAVGNPLDLQESATLGTVSAVNGTASEAPNGPAGLLTGLIQTTATINPGNSGGALVSLQGQLIGIPTLEETNPDTNSASGLGYAISSNRVQTVAQQIIQHGSVTSTGQGFLGIEGQSTQGGVIVQGFAPDAAGVSPAQQAGVQAGDVITAVNGQSISDNNDLASAIATQAPNTKVTLTLDRSGSQVTVTVTLGERPTNA